MLRILELIQEGYIKLTSEDITGEGTEQSKGQELRDDASHPKPSRGNNSKVGMASDSNVEKELGISISEAIAIWEKEGAPVIHLGLGENCFDLRRLLSNPNPRHIQKIQEWLQQKKDKLGSDINVNFLED